MTGDLLVDTPAEVTVTAFGPIRHICPYVDELDEGTVEITWSTSGATFELHALRQYLDGFADVKASHEEVAAAIRVDLDSPGLTVTEVVVRFPTARFEVTVEAVEA